MSFTSMHNDWLDPDRHGEQEPPDWYMEGQKVVFDFFSCDENETEAQQIAHCQKWLYKSTDCGAWIEFTEDGIIIGSIVEGCDFGTATYPLSYNGLTSKDIQDRIDAVEDEADALWKWANEADDDGMTQMDHGVDAPDVSYEYMMFEQGERV